MTERWLVGTLMSLLILSVGLAGCAAAPVAIGMGLDAILGAVGIYQRYEDRGAQRDQTEEIRNLRLEIKTLRETVKEERAR